MEDRGGRALARLLAMAALIGAAAVVSAQQAAQPASEVSLLVERIGERVARYYHRAQSLVCIETSTVQPIHPNWSLEGMARTVESELRVESETADGVPLQEARLVREVRRVNGREPRERDKTDRSGCTDPDPFSPEPLAFLLPSRREAFRFTAVHEGRERNRQALVIDFASATHTTRADLVEDPRGHDDCFDWTGPIAVSGRVWVDAVTYEVLRVDRYNAGPVDLRVSWALQRKYNLTNYVTLDRNDLTLRFREVSFANPDEIVLLPEEIDELTIVRTGLQSMRRTTTFSNYHRFLTSTRIVKGR